MEVENWKWLTTPQLFWGVGLTTVCFAESWPVLYGENQQ